MSKYLDPRYRFWHWACRWFYWARMASGFPRLVSALHQALFDRRWRRYPVTTYPSVSALAAVMRGFSWRPDGLASFWDSFCDLGRIQAILDGSLSPESRWGHGSDCDEAARYICYALRLSTATGTLLRDFQPQILTIMWVLPGGIVGGHNVALLWFSPSRCAYMDYGDPGPIRDSIRAVVADVLARRAPEGAQVLAYCVQDLDLKPVLTVREAM